MGVIEYEYVPFGSLKLIDEDLELFSIPGPEVGVRSTLQVVPLGRPVSLNVIVYLVGFAAVLEALKPR